MARTSRRPRNHGSWSRIKPHHGEPPILTDESAQRQFEELTQKLVDLAIEITDILSGDPDEEPTDEFEDDNGL